jgi:glycine cleavage system H protein
MRLPGVSAKGGKEVTMKGETCPFLEVKTVIYCKAFPVKKMIPVERQSSSKGLCGTSQFQECTLFKEVSCVDKEMQSIRGFLIKSDFYYHPRHLWVCFPEGNDSEVRVGIDDFAQKTVGKIDRISLPPEKTAVKEGSVCFLVHSGKRKVRMIAPVNGIVAEVNQALSSHPAIINEDPYCEGWVLKVKLTGDGIKGLFYGSSAQNWLKWEVERLQRMFAESLGVTATNGGETLPDISSQLNEHQWGRIVEFFLE